MIKELSRYTKFWWLMCRNSFTMVLGQKLPFTIFLIGKIFRFFFFFSFLYFLVAGTKSLAGYTSNQAIFFFLTFNVIDIITQFLFREVYRFRPMVVNGEFDNVLVKPISPLFRVLMGGADIIDLVTIPPLIFAVWYVGSLLSPSTLDTLFYILLLLNGFLIATAFHIIVLSLGIITLEIDHTIMIYRDLTSLGRLPIDIYKQPLQAFLTYLIPVGLMMTLPAKALMGIISPVGILSSFLLGLLAIFISLKFWNFALKKYTSASS